jgi:hypothetical protein
MEKITLKQICELMKKINESRDFEAYFSNGKPIIQTKFIEITK